MDAQVAAGETDDEGESEDRHPGCDGKAEEEGERDRERRGGVTRGAGEAVRWLDQAAESDGTRRPEPGDGALHKLREEMGEDEGERAVTPDGFDAGHTPHEEESRHAGDDRGVAEAGHTPHPECQPPAAAKHECV